MSESNNPIAARIKLLEGKDRTNVTNVNTKNLNTLRKLQQGLTAKEKYEDTIALTEQKVNAKEPLTEENERILRTYEEYQEGEKKRSNRSECIFNMLTEKEKAEVVAKMTVLVNSFSSKRKAGEGLGVIAATGTAAVSATAGTFASIASAGAAVIATGPFAIPITVGLISIAAIIGFYLRQKALNEELQGNLIAIKGEVERLYFIYKVIEKIAKEKNLNINTAMVRKFTILLTNNILLMAGPEVFALIKKSVNENPNALFTPEIFGPARSETAISVQEKRSRWSMFSFSVQRFVIPAELLRIIIRDVTILSIFFTILQSELDLLLKEYDSVQKRGLLTAITSSSLDDSLKGAFEKYLTGDSWLESDEYFRFKCNLPFNNLELQHTSERDLVGTLQLPLPAPLPSLAEPLTLGERRDSTASTGTTEAPPSTASTGTNEGSASTGTNPRANSPSAGSMKGGKRKTKSKRYSVLSRKTLSLH